MSWRRRLLEIALAGGMTVAGTGCQDPVRSPGQGIPLCNADPDPCCYDPFSDACYAKQHQDLSVPAGDMGATDLAVRDLTVGD